MFLMISLLIVIILIDTFLIRFYDLINKNLVPLTARITVFGATIVLCLLLEFVLLRNTKQLNFNIKAKKKISFEKFLYISLLSISVLVGLLLFQILYLNYYSTDLLLSVILVIYGTVIILIVRTMILFASWYRINLDLVFLLYSISMSMIIFNLSLTCIVLVVNLDQKPEQIRQFSGGSMDITAGRYGILSSALMISSILSFGSIWLTTALLMHSAKDQLIEEIRYWSILVIPLIYFLISYFAQDIFSSMLFPMLVTDPVSVSRILTSFFILSKPIGGIIFGILYWRISRQVRFEKSLQRYMIISGYGFLLLFSANQSVSLVLGPYPPFGVATATILVLAAYFILTGIYVSATVVSSDTQLRSTIYKMARESKLLDLLGKVEAQKEVEESVAEIMKKVELSESSKDFNYEMDETEFRSYLEEVMDELGKRKNQDNL